MLLQHDVHASGRQLGDQPVVGIQRIGQQHIPGLERTEQRARQSQFAVPGAAMGARGRLQQRAAGQIDQRAQAGQRKAGAPAWLTGRWNTAWF
jgi:hypothetical protein